MLAGQKVGPFQIEKELGSGAMGQVYLARYVKTGQKVAIKVMAPGVRSSLAQARFQREAEVLKQLTHPNIVRFYVASEFQGSAYYAMEYIEGESLDDLLSRRGRLPWDEVVELGKQACAALQHAHEKGIIHRDLKPSNLIIAKDHTLKLADFGIAKDLDETQLTATNSTVGTAAYMSPEQCRGERTLTNKSDLYSLGVVLYELLIGDKPFHADTTMDMFLAHVQGTFERPARRVMEIPVWLDNLVCQLLEKKPEQRPFDAAMVADSLERVAEKVNAQSSAGVDAARARVGGRGADETTPDQDDRQAARTLLGATKKKKRRARKKKPAYEQVWVQAFGLIAMLASIGFFVFEQFKPASAETLFAQAQRIMDSGDFDAKLQARKSGPIEQFLHSYGNTDTPLAKQMKQWADEIDVTQRERTLANRKHAGMAPESDFENGAQKALALEEAGDLVRAKDIWFDVLKAKDVPDSSDRSLGLIAEKHLQDIHLADDHDSQLQIELQTARNLGKPYTPPAEAERLASEALRFEKVGDIGLACARWQELAQRNDKSLANRPWVLLARSKLRELANKQPADTDEKAARIEVLERAYAEVNRQASEGRNVAARTICQDILDLYSQSTDLDVKGRLANFQTKMKALPEKDG